MVRAPGKHAFAFVLITVFPDMVGFGLIRPVLPALIEDVGSVGLAQAAVIGGWMFLAFSMAQVLCAPLMGNLSNRFGRRPLLLLAIFGLGRDYILSALAPTLFWLFVGRVRAGICGSSWVIANAFIADVKAPDDRARAFGLMGTAFGVGFGVGPAIGGLQGGISAVTNIAMLMGTVTFSHVFAAFMAPDAAWQTPDAAYFLSSALLACTLGLYLWTVRRVR